MSRAFIQKIGYFTPVSVAGCQLWLDGADTTSSSMILSGSTVNTWKDKSGNGYNFTQTSYSTSLPPLSNITTGTGVYFGSLQGLFNTSFPFPTTYTIFSVANQTTNNGAYQYILHSPYNADYIIFFGALNGNFATFTGSGGWNDVNANSPSSSIANTSNTASLVSCTNNGTTLTPYFNAVAMTTKNGANASATGITLGDTDTAHPRQPWLGTVGEMIIYNSILSTPQRQSIEGYLAQKWGLTASLPPGHPGLTQTFYTAGKNPGIAAVPSFTMTNVPYTNYFPLSIAGCQLWLDGADSSAASMVLSGNNLNTWIDKSSNAYTCGIAVGCNATAPVYNTTTKAVQFVAGNSNALATPQAFGNIIVNNTSTFLFVGQRTAASGYHYFMSGQSSSSTTVNMQLGFYNDNMQTNIYAGPVINTAITVYSAPDPIRIYCYDVINTGADQVLNGSVIATNTSNFLLTSYQIPEFGRRYGNTAAVAYHTINIFEVVVYVPALTTLQRQQVEGYLAWKWGTQSTLINTHPYYSAPPIEFNRPTQVAGLPLVKQMTYYLAPGNLPYYQVRAVDWSSSWQPYLQGLVTANSTATASLSTYSAGSAANYTASSYGALAPNGLMYFIGGTGVFVLNPTTNTATILGSVNTGSYSGLVLGTNGNLYGIPYGSGTVLVITPSATSPYGTVTTIGAALDSYQGGCLGPNGTIYALPWTGANILTINTSTNTATQVAISPYCYTRGSVLGPDGNIYGCPWGSSTILKINTTTNTSSTIACDGGRYWGCCLAPNGLIYFSHFDSGHFAILNVFTNAVTTAGSPPSAYNNCVVLGPNGKLYLSGGYTNILEYNYNTNTYATIGSTPATSGSSINLAPNGNLYIPGTSATVGNYISFSGLSQLPTSNYCLSAYTNKF